MAPAVRTFLTGQEWVGKMVIPFTTHGGWPGHAIKDIKAACRGAEVVCERDVRFDSRGGDHMETAEKAVEAWIAAVTEILEGE